MELINPLVIDLESYYDNHVSVARGKLTYVEYARHPEFELFGAGVSLGREPTQWLRPKELREYVYSLAPNTYTLVGHNLQFDGCVLSEQGITFSPKSYFCTQAAASALFGSQLKSHSLNNLALQFLADHKHPGVLADRLGKHWCDLSLTEREKEASYCEQDVNLTLRLADLFYPAMPQEELTTLSHTMQMYIDPMLEVDQDLLRHAIHESEAEREQYLLQARNILQDSDLIKKLTVNETLKILGSNKQFATVLNKFIPVIPTKPSPSKPGTFIPALAKADLEMQALVKSSIPEVAALCTARLNAKSNIIRTRAERFLKDDVPKSRTYLNYMGAIATGRDSGGQRSNKQNLTRGSALRHSIRAPKGYKLLVIDSAGVEMRSMFYIAGQQDQIDLILQGDDLYCKAAEHIYHRPINKIDDHDERAVGKVQLLSLQYGSGWRKMQYIFAAGLMGPAITLTDDEAYHIHQVYRKKNYQVKKFWNTADNMITQMARGIGDTYYIPGTECPLFSTNKDQIFMHSRQLPMHFSNLFSDPAQGWHYYSKGHPNKIYGGMLTGRLNQAFARDIVFHQINKVAERYRLLLRVHDEGVFLVPDDKEEIEEAEAYALSCFSQSPAFAPGLPLKGEVVTAREYLKP